MNKLLYECDKCRQINIIGYICKCVQREEEKMTEKEETARERYIRRVRENYGDRYSVVNFVTIDDNAVIHCNKCNKEFSISAGFFVRDKTKNRGKCRACETKKAADPKDFDAEFKRLYAGAWEYKNYVQRRYNVEMYCCRCGAKRIYNAGYVLSKKIECACLDVNGDESRKLKKALRAFAISLANDMLEDEFVLVSDELVDYIKNTLASENPKLLGRAEALKIDAIEVVTERILDAYERKGIKMCKGCQEWVPRVRLWNGLCKNCRN